MKPFMGTLLVALLLAPGEAVLGEEAASPPPPADMAIGFFYNYELMDRAREPEWFSMMAAHGCNTVTVYFRRPDDLARQLDLAVETGLAKYPIFLVANVDDTGPVIAEARRIGRHAEQWPELLFYGPDEVDVPDRCNPEAMKALQEQTHAQGLRLGVTGYGPALMILAPWVDVTISISYWATESLRKRVEDTGGEFWVYEVGPIHTGENARMARFLTGWWAWKVRPKGFLAWSFMDLVTPTLPEGGGAERPALDGWHEGTVDYRVLQELETAITEHPGVDAGWASLWLQEVEDRVPWNPNQGQIGRPPEYDKQPYLQSTRGDPPIRDFEALRQHADYWVHKLTGRPMRW